MKIYSRSLKSETFFKKEYCFPLEQATFESNSIYYYDRLDEAVFNIPFDKMIDQVHWDHINRDPTSKIIIGFYDDFFHKFNIQNIAETLIKQKVDPSRVYFLTSSTLFTEFARKEFLNYGITTINIQDFNIGLAKTKVSYVAPHRTIKKKFSILSRNYRDWRLKLYARLVQENLLYKVMYSFSNIDPYVTPNKIFDNELLKQILKENNFTIDETLNKWIDNIPYQLGIVEDKFSDVTYFTIASTHMHILVESHFDTFLNYHGPRCQERDFAPAFLTEKTYKVIAQNKPFIAFSTPYFLEGLRELGFKSFNGIINEDYDLIVNDNERLEAVVQEIKRINSLGKKEFNSLIDRTKEITSFNAQKLLEHKKDIDLVNEFDWITSLLNDDILKKLQ